jgi:diacylglycerol kinase family enzyme
MWYFILLIKLIACYIGYKFIFKSKYIPNNYSSNSTQKLVPYLLVIINPTGGKRNGNKIFDTIVAPQLKSNNIHFRVVITKYAEHAYELVNCIDTNLVRGIIAVGGDGHIHQIVNGLKNHPDKDAVIKVTIGCIAAGTGNGIARSLEILDPNVSTKAIIDNVKTKISWIKLCGHNLDNKIGLLSLTCGFIANFDELMERRLRFIKYGFIRWILSEIIVPLYLIIKNPKFKVNISVLPLVNKSNINRYSSKVWKPHSDHTKAENGWLEFKGYVTTLALCNLPYIAEKIYLAPYIFDCEGEGLDLMMLAPISRFQLLKFFLQAEHGNHVTSKYVSYITIKKMELKVKKDYDISFDGEAIKSNDKKKEIICEVSDDKINFFSPIDQI